MEVASASTREVRRARPEDARASEAAAVARRVPVLSGVEIAAAAERFAGVEQTTELLQWLIATFGDRWLLASSWQHAVIVDQLSKLMDRVPVVELDTELLFAETYETRDRILERYTLDVISMRASRSVAEQAVALGPNLWERDPDRCCHERKVIPLRQVLEGRDAWLTGMRRSQSSTRRDVQVVERDRSNGVVKVNPLAWWSDADIAAYVAIHEVPTNPLLTSGFPSIGCFPCTQPVTGDDSRGGRWAGTAKTECGLHVRPVVGPS